MPPCMATMQECKSGWHLDALQLPGPWGTSGKALLMQVKLTNNADFAVVLLQAMHMLRLPMMCQTSRLLSLRIRDTLKQWSWCMAVPRN